MESFSRIHSYRSESTARCWSMFKSCGVSRAYALLTCVCLTSAFLGLFYCGLMWASREPQPACTCQSSPSGDPEPPPGCIVSSLNATYDSDSVVDRFRRYLRIRTDQPNPDYCCAVVYLQRIIDSIGGLETKEVSFTNSSSSNKPFLIVTWRGSNPSLPSVLLNSHMDVVQADPTAWTHDPFCAFMEENGDIYARGAQDTKDAGMMYLEAIRNLKEQSFVPTRTIHVTFVPDEEIAGEAGFIAFASSQQFRDLNVGVALDEGGVTEGNFFTLNVGEKVQWPLTIIATGTPTHGALMIENGALENLFKSIDLILEYRQIFIDQLKAGALAGDITSISPTYLNAGITTPTGYVTNVQPGRAIAGFDIRISPINPEDPQVLLRRINEEWAPADRNMSYQFSMANALAPVTVANESNPWYVLLRDAVYKSGHNLSKPIIAFATTDMRFVRALGIPCFNIAPVSSTISRLHSDNEYLNAGVYLAGIPVYEEIIKAFASFTGSYESSDISSRRDEAATYVG